MLFLYFFSVSARGQQVKMKTDLNSSYSGDITSACSSHHLTLAHQEKTLFHRKVLYQRDMTQNHKNRWSMTKIWPWGFYKVCPPHTPFPIIKDRRLCRPKSSCTFPMGYGGGGGHTLEKPQGQIFVLDHLYT